MKVKSDLAKCIRDLELIVKLQSGKFSTEDLQILKDALTKLKKQKGTFYF